MVQALQITLFGVIRPRRHVHVGGLVTATPVTMVRRKISFPANGLQLRANELAVWTVDVADFDTSITDSLIRTLSASEILRANRFKKPDDKCRYIYARGVLRHLLSGYLSLDPVQLNFAYNDYGKPGFACGESPTVCFNISHSKDIILLAFAATRPVGVDVEEINHKSRVEALANRFFSTEESLALALVPPGGKHESFFETWTQKEAFLKAQGTGISNGLNHSTMVSLGNNSFAVLTSSSGETYTVYSLAAPQGYKACAAVQGLEFELAQHTLELR